MSAMNHALENGAKAGKSAAAAAGGSTPFAAAANSVNYAACTLPHRWTAAGKWNPLWIANFTDRLFLTATARAETARAQAKPLRQLTSLKTTRLRSLKKKRFKVIDKTSRPRPCRACFPSLARAGVASWFYRWRPVPFIDSACISAACRSYVMEPDLQE